MIKKYYSRKSSMKQSPLDRSLFNLDLLIPDDDTFRNLGLLPVTNLAIFESTTDAFNKNGLFSNVIFGNIGSDTRMLRPAYIDLKLKIFHPLVFITIERLGKKYKEILAGRLYARFDKVEKDFVPDPENGNTGFHFFCQHLDEIVYKTTESNKRDYKISLVEKYGRSSGLFKTFLVIPAGLRDYTVDDKGVPSEDEINDFYRKLVGLHIKLSNLNITEETIALYDPIRYQIQMLVNDIYRYIKGLIDGKSKFIQAKWSSRGVAGSTANVITALPNVIKDLDYENNVNFNSTVVGLYQYLKALGNITANRLHSVFLSHIFSTDRNEVRLINPKTLKSEYVKLNQKTYEDWTSLEGVNNIINKLNQDVIKNEYVKMDGYYPALVYDEGKTVKIIFDTEYMDPSLDIKKLRPITYAEMFYISVVGIVNRFPALVTRYPITGRGSIYPTYPYLKTTKLSKHVSIEVGGSTYDAPEYPIIPNDYVRSMAPHYTHLEKLGADFDGDTMSFILLYTEESIKEVDELLNTKEYYLNTLGEINYSVSNNTLDITLKSLTE